MPAPLSIDLRKRIMMAYENGTPVKVIAQQFYVGQDCVYKLIKHVNTTGSLNSKPLNNGRKPKLNPQQLEQVAKLAAVRPKITLAKIIEQLDLPIGTSALSKIINDKIKMKPKQKN